MEFSCFSCVSSPSRAADDARWAGGEGRGAPLERQQRVDRAVADEYRGRLQTQQGPDLHAGGGPLVGWRGPKEGFLPAEAPALPPTPNPSGGIRQVAFLQGTTAQSIKPFNSRQLAELRTRV